MMDELDQVLNQQSPKFTSGDNDAEDCMMPHPQLCRGKGWQVLRERYVRMRIGDRADGTPVYEYAHRLVEWAKGTQEATVVMHMGPRNHERGACKRMMCVNPHHLEWGTQSNNVKEAYNRKKRLRA
jgi:hypothetical protein